MTTTPHMVLGLLASGQTSPEVPHNEAILKLDMLTSCSVADRDLTSPPAAVDGDRYLVAAAATGDWSGLDGMIVMYWSGQWITHTPKTGQIVYVEDEHKLICWVEATATWYDFATLY